jgi:hypothetical protein
MTELVSILKDKYKFQCVDVTLIDFLANKYPSCGIVSNVTSAEKDMDYLVPNEQYVETLIEKLENLVDILGNREYTRCKEALNKVLDDGDFDDAEDIMLSVHEALEKYIYKSDTKVALSDWKYLEQYLMEAGYTPLDINVGDNIKDSVKWFEYIIHVSNGVSGTIKNIFVKPYTLKYFDGDNVEELKLLGKCTVYK